MADLLLPCPHRDSFLPLSLSKWTGIHPFVRDRVRYLLRLADRYGGDHRVTSGKRSQAKQWKLYNESRNVPAAFPGCSQHEYGLAIDVQFRDSRWQTWYLDSARRIGLTTVPNDPYHVQALPASVIRPILEGAGRCPSADFVGRDYWSPQAVCRRSGESWQGSATYGHCVDPNDPFPRRSF